jgi:hypothetical protein
MMKNPYLRLLRGLVLLAVVSALLWMAAPNLGFLPNKSLSPLLVGAYGPSVGNLTIEKRDANTGDIIPVLGVAFAVTRASDGTLLLNVYDNDPNDKDSRPGYILLNNVPIGDYHVLEIQAPPGYLINPVLLDATPGGPPAVSRDEPVTHTAPSLSETGILIMIGGFAAAMVFLISRKSRRPLTPAA